LSGRRAPEQDGATKKLSPAARLLLLVLVVGLGAFAIGFLFTAVFLFRGGAGDEVVTVPDLRGRSEDQARGAAVRLGLSFELGPALVNPEVPQGQVLAQTPLPGEEVAPGSVLRVVMSAGPETRPVPDVRRMGSGAARDLLARSGFEAVVEEREDDAPAGRVIEMFPAPGTDLIIPGEVRLVVSTGPPLQVVPDVVGMAEAQARDVLGNAGFADGGTVHDELAPFPVGTVTAQTPAAGAAVRVGARVVLTVSGPGGGNL
jgi:eukaryotic-like serine/threonine-protein kinase